MNSCAVCSSDFKRKVHNQTMCSTVCVRKYRSRWMNKNYHSKMNSRSAAEVKCVVCRSTFEVKNNRGRPKTCSLECKDSMNKNRIKTWQINKKYGLSSSEVQQLSKLQNGCCAVCGEHESKFKDGLCVDHDHASGEVRGLLCRGCNSAIGLFKENEDALYAAIEYLRNNRRI